MLKYDFTVANALGGINGKKSEMILALFFKKFPTLWWMRKYNGKVDAISP